MTWIMISHLTLLEKIQRTLSEHAMLAELTCRTTTTSEKLSVPSDTLALDAMCRMVM